jgi:hypothetical protein
MSRVVYFSILLPNVNDSTILIARLTSSRSSSSTVRLRPSNWTRTSSISVSLSASSSPGMSSIRYRRIRTRKGTGRLPYRGTCLDAVELPARSTYHIFGADESRDVTGVHKGSARAAPGSVHHDLLPLVVCYRMTQKLISLTPVRQKSHQGYSPLESCTSATRSSATV